MLEIKNIERVIGMMCNGRQIAEAGEFVDGVSSREPHYTFTFDAIRDGKEYFSKKHIVIRRQKNENGNYEMFCMGLQMVTQIQIDYRTIKSPILLAEKIRDVLEKTQKWFNKI